MAICYIVIVLGLAVGVMTAGREKRQPFSRGKYHEPTVLWICGFCWCDDVGRRLQRIEQHEYRLRWRCLWRCHAGRVGRCALPDAPSSSDVQLPTDVLPGTDTLVADVPAREVAVPADTNGSQDVTAPGDAGLDGQIPNSPSLDAATDAFSDGESPATGGPVDAKS